MSDSAAEVSLSVYAEGKGITLYLDVMFQVRDKDQASCPEQNRVSRSCFSVTQSECHLFAERAEFTEVSGRF